MNQRRLAGLLSTWWALPATIGAQVPPPEGVPRFVDVTAGSGIVFQHLNGPVDRKDFIFETKGGGVAFLDYDLDGFSDALVVQGSTIEQARSGIPARTGLFRNRGDGTFEDVSGKAGLDGVWGMGVGIGDYDNDGDPDIFLSQLGPDRLYRNQGNGRFEDVSKAAGIISSGWSTSAAFGDYDGDGFLDLYVAGYLDYGVDHLPPKTRDCTYLGVPVLCGPRGLEGGRDYLYRNNGDGTFSDVTESSGAVDRRSYFGLGVVWSDLDDDGDLDLIVGNDATPNYLFVNQGNGTFVESGFLSGLAVSGDGNEQASMGVEAADYDNDGRLDVFMTHFASDYSTLYHNDGNLLFTDVSSLAGLKDPEWFLVAWGTRLVDVNHDGWKDILHSSGHVYPYLKDGSKPEAWVQPCMLYMNRMDGTFVDAGVAAGLDLQNPMVGRGAAFSDYDNDGDIDFLVANLNGQPRLFRSDRTESHHWLMLRLAGVKGNRDAIGAKVSVECSGLRQVWEVRRTVGIYSSSDPRVHFGLGSCPVVESLVVRWPGGSTQSLKSVPADRHYFLREGEALRVE